MQQNWHNTTPGTAVQPGAAAGETMSGIENKWNIKPDDLEGWFRTLPQPMAADRVYRAGYISYAAINRWYYDANLPADKRRWVEYIKGAGYKTIRP